MQVFIVKGPGLKTVWYLSVGGCWKFSVYKSCTCEESKANVAVIARHELKVRTRQKSRKTATRRFFLFRIGPMTDGTEN